MAICASNNFFIASLCVTQISSLFCLYWQLDVLLYTFFYQLISKNIKKAFLIVDEENFILEFNGY